MIMIWWYELWYNNGGMTYDYDMVMNCWLMAMIWNESHDFIISEMTMNGLIMICYNLWLWYDDGMNYVMIMNNYYDYENMIW